MIRPGEETSQRAHITQTYLAVVCKSCQLGKSPHTE